MNSSFFRFSSWEFQHLDETLSFFSAWFCWVSSAWQNSPKTALQKSRVAVLLTPPHFSKILRPFILCPRQAPTTTSPTIHSLFRVPDYFVFSSLNNSLRFYGIPHPIHFLPELCHGGEEFLFLGTDPQPAACSWHQHVPTRTLPVLFCSSFL